MPEGFQPAPGHRPDPSLDALCGCKISVTDFKRDTSYCLARPLDRSNVDYLRCILDLVGETAAAVTATYLQSPHKDRYPFAESLNPSIKGYSTPREVIANHCFDMASQLHKGCLRAFILSECTSESAIREQRDQVSEELYECTMYMVDVRNSL
ncbi:hypothetical protein KIPB_012345, partial [Kipferlia bialata]|eukprot:g12345.t1